MRKSTILLLALFLLLFAGISHAQEVVWSAYVYNNTLKELTRVSIDGTQQTYSLGLPEGAFVSSYDMSFNADGSQVAYCVIDYPPNASLGHATLYLRDIAGETNLLAMDLGDVTACTMGREALSGNLVTVGMMNYYPDDPNADTSEPVWQLLVVDVTTGVVVNQLNEGAFVPNMGEAGLLPAFPRVLRFDGTRVIFIFLPFATEGLAEYVAHSWDLSSGAIEQLPYWGQNGFDWLEATGEMTWTDIDPTLAAGTPMGIGASYNVVMLANGVDEPRIILYDGAWISQDTEFILDGQQLAVAQSSSFDPNNPETPAVLRWIAIDRSGNIFELYRGAYYSNVVAAPGGYAIMVQDLPGGDFTQGRFTFTYYLNDVPTLLWEGSSSDGSYWEIAWTAPTPAAESLQPFLTAVP
jgi:hypothetical protein